MKFKNQFTAVVFAAATLALSNTASAQFSTPMRDIDNAVKGAVAFKYDCALAGPASTMSCTTSYAIPAGYRLAVTQMSSVLSANAPIVIELRGTHAGQSTTVVHHFVPAMGYNLNTFSLYFLSANTDFTFDTLVPSACRVLCNNCNLAGGTVQISGHLVKL